MGAPPSSPPARPVVVGAVALAPWVLASDVPRGVEGKPILIVQGSRDRVADPRAPPRWPSGCGLPVSATVVVDGAKHAMLRHHNESSRRAAEFAAATLLGGQARSVVPR